MSKIKVTVWNEYIHEKRDAKIGKIYPEGIHGAIRQMLGKYEELEIRTATLDMEDHGRIQPFIERILPRFCTML